MIKLVSALFAGVLLFASSAQSAVTVSCSNGVATFTMTGSSAGSDSHIDSVMNGSKCENMPFHIDSCKWNDYSSGCINRVIKLNTNETSFQAYNSGTCTKPIKVLKCSGDTSNPDPDPTPEPTGRNTDLDGRKFKKRTILWWDDWSTSKKWADCKSAGGSKVKKVWWKGNREAFCLK